MPPPPPLHRTVPFNNSSQTRPRQAQGGGRSDVEEEGEEDREITGSLYGSIDGTGGGVGSDDIGGSYDIGSNEGGDGGGDGGASGALGGSSTRVWVCGYCTEEHVLLREERGERFEQKNVFCLFSCFFFLDFQFSIALMHYIFVSM